MGIIDDYYGGYENLALFTDEYGSIDFEAAYDSQLPDDYGYFDDTLDPWERGFQYKLNQALRELILPGWTDTGRETRSGQPIYEGDCSNCGKHTTVPFVPLSDGSPPMCRECHANHKPNRSRRKNGAGPGGSKAAPIARGNGGSSSSRAGGAGCSRAADQGVNPTTNQEDA